MLKNLSVSLFLLAGCTVMVNGKPRRIGGGSDPEPAAQAQAPAPGQAPQGKQASVPSVPAGQLIKVDSSIGRDPLVMSIDTVLDTSFGKMFGLGTRSPDCSAYDMPSQPIASFQITQPDHDLNVAVLGGRNDGFIVRRGGTYWSQCGSTMGPIDGGWTPGRYDIYPLGSDYGKLTKATYQLELFRPNAPAPAGEQQKLVISGKLDKPMFVEVSLKANRRKLRDEHSGDSCGKVALSPTTDLALTIERPVPGLTIRPLPSAMPITLRFEKPGDAQHHGRKYCVNNGERQRTSADKGPSYETRSELHFDNNDEGLYGISFGTPENPASASNVEAKITLLVYDASTKLDPMYVRPYGGDNPTLEQRWIGYQMPQLNVYPLGRIENYDDAERNALVFAAVPKQALVYAKLTFDKDIGGGEGYPVKNEPLAVVDIDERSERVTVMSADGFQFTVKQSHVVLAPDGPIALPAAPRPFAKMDIGRTIAMLSPAQKKLGEAHYAKVKAHDDCLDRAWEPYRRQLPSYSRPAGVDIIVYKSARTKAIEEAGERAMVKKCGTNDAFEKRTEATRAKLALEVEKARVKLLAQATANLK
jgi:hypothetical protein